MNSLDRIVLDVDSKTTITESAVQLLHNIASAVKAMAGNADASRQFADMLDREAPRLAARILANTPMILATPPVHPPVEPSSDEVLDDADDQ